MSYSNFAQSIVDVAKSTRSKDAIREEIERVKNACESKQEYILSMGYAVHYADNKTNDRYAKDCITYIFGAMKYSKDVGHATEIAKNANGCRINTLAPHIKDMIARNNDVDALVNELMGAVYYANTSHEQSLILRLTESGTRNMAQQKSADKEIEL
ncbi:hypothetical protein [Aeromonas sp. MrichA-1]|uniref:hypothetical protein n=1 Tax=Aeromonas sp. MrichA-1 TaxID=2823362 RepID=UPI001B32354F|nr:hypothetical protein [Aeromonas sp. MrichA-1]MBP4081750.1 hypothetical protein [Aeromonas sp. MrichA-1]